MSLRCRYRFIHYRVILRRVILRRPRWIALISCNRGSSLVVLITMIVRFGKVVVVVVVITLEYGNHFTRHSNIWNFVVGGFWSLSFGNFSRRWVEYRWWRTLTMIYHRNFVQWGSWNNSLNWRNVFKCLNFIWQTWYLKYKLFNWCLCPWVFWLLWKPKLFFQTFITTKISIFWEIFSGNIAQS